MAVDSRARRSSLENRVEQLERMIEELLAEKSKDSKGDFDADWEADIEHEFHFEHEDGSDADPFHREESFVWKSHPNFKFPDVHFDTEHFEKTMKEAEKAMKESTKAYEKAFKDAHRRMEDQQKLSRIEQNVREIESLKRKHVELNARKAQLEAMIQAKRQERNRLNDDLQDLQAALGQLEDEFESIDEEHEESGH